MRVEDILVEVIHETLKPMRFRRRRRSWYRLTDEVYSVVSIQRSDWHEGDYINFGFSLAEVMAESWISQGNCPIQFVFGNIASVDVEDEVLLREDRIGDLSDDELRSVLSDKVASPVLDVLRLTIDLSGLKNVLRSKISGGLFIHKDIRPLLD